MQRAFKGVWIPANIWLSKELSLQEKVLLAEIESLDNENGCYATNDYFAEFFGLSKRQVSRSISNLKEKEFISLKLIYKKGTKQIEKRVIRVVHYGGKKDNITPIDKNVHTYRQNCPDPIDNSGDTPIDKNGVENNPCINNPINIKTKDEDRDPIIDLLIENKIVAPAALSKTLLDDLNDITNNFGFEEPQRMITEAIKESVRGNGKTWRFVYNKLHLWRKFGVKTMADLEEHKEREANGIHQHRNGNAGGSGKGSSYEQAMRELEASKRAVGRGV